ncbi:MAG: hypothetical protein M1812_002394 [Candelaria pacifica]|nr:MAG: hypothetical protein M1812_002394 [Candelaria pacifica]
MAYDIRETGSELRCHRLLAKGEMMVEPRGSSHWSSYDKGRDREPGDFDRMNGDLEEKREQGSLPPQCQPTTSQDGKTLVSFTKDDPEDPTNWSTRKKCIVVVIGMSTVINSTLGSALPSGAMPEIAKHFHITNDQQMVLPISMYLVGYVLGPLLFGPLSETYGRKGIMLSTFFLFTVFTMACALSPNWPALLVFRLIVGINAASPITVVGGLYADIFDDPVTRGRAMVVFMAGTALGPIFGPIISGFISVKDWRWTFWVGLMIAGLSWPPLLLLPETYGPTILKRRAEKLRKETSSESFIAPIELEKKGVKQMVTVTLARPIRMFLFEALVLFTCLYLAFVYAIFYIFLQAYPIIFEGTYGMNPGLTGLAFLPIGVGSLIACGGFFCYDSILQNAKRKNAAWAASEEYRRLPLACIAGPAMVISLFWLGWTARSSVHWIVPMLAGLPFGIGFLFIFMALLNYLADAYGTYTASAMAAASCTRSIFGAVLPLATKPMYETLSVAWASTLLGCLSLALSIIPFVFIRYGDRLRANSKFCQYLLQQKQAQQDAMRSKEQMSVEEKG